MISRIEHGIRIKQALARRDRLAFRIADHLLVAKERCASSSEFLIFLKDMGLSPAEAGIFISLLQER
jgi:hypothetical protein